MENNNFPPLEPENDLPEVFSDIPARMEPLEDLPVIEELTFRQESAGECIQEPPVSDTAKDKVSLSDTQLPQDAAPTPESTQEDIAFCEPFVQKEILDDDFPMTQHVMETYKKRTPDAEPASAPQTVVLEEIPDQEYRDNSHDFEEMFQTAAAPRLEPAQPAPLVVTSKGRPKRKKGEGLLGIPSILVTFVWLALIVVIGVTAGRMLWICAADVLAFGREDKVVTVTIYEADTMEDIIDKLHEGGLIRYKSLFNLYAGISDAEEDIKPGIYDLNTRYDYHALVNFMSPRSSREVIKLTIPEGYTCRQIFALLEENRICTAVDAAAYAANGDLSDYWFLEGIQRGSNNCLEGYLFPDTYEFYKNSTPREAIEKMLDNFEYRFDEEMAAQLETLNQKVTDGSYGIREIVIIASLIEKESAAPGESPKVAGVIYNRLFRWGNNRPLLNIDATIVYAQEGQNERIDTKLDHPYNTYLYEGLTPGPIANPGLASLKAALNPESHNYYYYVLNPETGMHQFSTTYEEHSSYVRQFNAAPEVEIE